jgi:CheY-like chemotaxis protein
MKNLPAILLVDDDEDHLLVARRAIERADLPADVRVAGAGDEALRVLGLHAPSADPPPPVKVVMLDLGLPDMSGWEVLKRIRASERTRRTPVVVVSSSNRPEDVRRSYELGANSYLVKRFDRRHPGDYLAEAARYWVELNEPSRGPGRRDVHRPREGPPGRERVPRRRRADDASDRD